ncbi:MAG: uroporphyrinogen decarboxylase family protein [Phycisphaerae bacterium]
MRPWASEQSRGDLVVWATFEGFFWFPRTLLGIEPHLYAFHDRPELIHRINADLAAHTAGLIAKLAKVCVPTFVTFAEDMSYNHGPMLSKPQFDQFIAPYYRRIIPLLDELDVLPIVDTDGDVSILAGWLQEAGVKGVLPLERQAGVDAAGLRAEYPRLRMIGHYDKMVMPRGETAMRAEFERLLPTARKGGFIPSVDHQTPPGVSLEQYRCYVRLLEEFSTRAAKTRD